MVAEMVGSVKGIAVSRAIAVIAQHRLRLVFAVHHLLVPVEVSCPVELFGTVYVQTWETRDRSRGFGHMQLLPSERIRSRPALLLAQVRTQVGYCVYCQEIFGFVRVVGEGVVHLGSNLRASQCGPDVERLLRVSIQGGIVIICPAQARFTVSDQEIVV